MWFTFLESTAVRQSERETLSTLGCNLVKPYIGCTTVKIFMVVYELNNATIADANFMLSKRFLLKRKHREIYIRKRLYLFRIKMIKCYVLHNHGPKITSL